MVSKEEKQVLVTDSFFSYDHGTYQLSKLGHQGPPRQLDLDPQLGGLFNFQYCGQNCQFRSPCYLAITSDSGNPTFFS